MDQVLCVVLCAAFVSCQSHDTRPLRERIQTQTLDNGVRLIVLPIEDVSGVSAVTVARVGSPEETVGARGLAHFFEHMAFKGTHTIGTTDYQKEQQVLEPLFQLGDDIVDYRREHGVDETAYKLMSQRAELEAKADEFQKSEEFIQILNRVGGANINAHTTSDLTTYLVTLPNQALRLWAYMESERFLHPVLRGFFSEQRVVAEERRMRVDPNATILVIEELLHTAYDGGPYSELPIGPMEDIQNYQPRVAKQFYQTHYTPDQLVVSVVGHLDAKRTFKILKEAFAKLTPVKQAVPPESAPVNVIDPAKRAFPRSAKLKGQSPSRFVLAYHVPVANAKADDSAALQVVSGLLCQGETSRLLKSLVYQKQSALSVGCDTGFPGERLDHLFIFIGFPHSERSNGQLVDDIKLELKALASQGPTDDELTRVKKMYEADVYRKLEDPLELAELLATGEVLYNDEQYVFQEIDRLRAVTSADVQRVVQTYFVPQRETVVTYDQVK